MRIGIVGSMQFIGKMLELQNSLNSLGHDAFLTGLAPSFVGKTENEIETLKIDQKQSIDTIREFWEVMQGADAMLVANFDKHRIKNYIGGATLMEIGFAHILRQKIFLLNPIPEIEYYKTEIEAVKPVVIKGNLSLVK